MSKTAKIILEIIAAICAGLLGGYGSQALMWCHGKQWLQNLSVRLCGAAHREQYRAGGVSGGRHRRCGRGVALLRGAVVPAGRLDLRPRPVHQNHQEALPWKKISMKFPGAPSPHPATISGLGITSNDSYIRKPVPLFFICYFILRKPFGYEVSSNSYKYAGLWT